MEKQLLLKKQPEKTASLVELLTFLAKSQSQKPNQTHPQFSARDISELAFLLSNQTYKPPHEFGPYIFIGQHYPLAE